MSPEDTTAKVIMIIASELNYYPWAAAPMVTVDNSLDDLNVEALDRCCIACELEERFEIEISDDAQAGWETVQDVVDTVLQAEVAA